MTMKEFVAVNVDLTISMKCTVYVNGVKIDDLRLRDVTTVFGNYRLIAFSSDGPSFSLEYDFPCVLDVAANPKPDIVHAESGDAHV